LYLGFYFSAYNRFAAAENNYLQTLRLDVVFKSRLSNCR